MQQSATQRGREKNAGVVRSRIRLKMKKLSQRQLNAIEMLLRGLSDAQVGQQTGVDRGTIFRWRQNPRFIAELERQRQAVTAQSAARLQSMIEPALDIIQRQISGDDPKTALRAASILLRVATPGRVMRMSDPEAAMQQDDLEALDAYINAPAPCASGHSLLNGDGDLSDEDRSNDGPDRV